MLKSSVLIILFIALVSSPLSEARRKKPPVKPPAKPPAQPKPPVVVPLPIPPRLPIKCPPRCAACNALGICIGCPANARLNGRTCVCNAGYWQASASPLVCQRCHQKCSACSGPNEHQCIGCRPGFHRFGNMCGCPEGFFFGNWWTRHPRRIHLLWLGRCQKCHASCAACTGIAENHCIRCRPGLTLHQGRCHKCHGICHTCSGPAAGQCTSCAANAQLISQPTGRTCACRQGFAAVHFQPLTCQACPATCTSCTSPNQCSACGARAVLTQLGAARICSCPGGTYQLTPRPVSCGLCHPSCQTCRGPGANQCTSCKINGQIVTNLGTCQACHASCNTCNGANVNQCTSCRPGAILKATPQGMTCGCPSRFYVDMTGGLLNCKKCDPSCLECSGPAPNQCSSCQKGGVFAGGRCQCPSNQYQTSLIPFACANCHPNCATCTGFGANQCKSCAVGFTQSGANCFKCDPNCGTCTGPAPNQCSGCPVNAILTNASGGRVCRCASMFLPQLVNNRLTCVPFQCAPTCATCSGPHREQCLTCKDPNHILDGGVCRNKQCHPNCLTCTKENDPKSCISCTAGAMLVGQECQCKPQHYQKTANPLKCVDCHRSCDSCNEDNKCLTCPANSILDPTTKLCGCAAGFFSDQTSERLKCLPCVATCKTCSSYRVCTSCPSTRQFLANGACVPCSTKCKTCSSAGPNSCASCNAFGVLRDVTGGKTCVCQDGFVEVTREPQVCKSCSLPCKSCSGTTTDECLTCFDDAFYVKIEKGGQCRCNAGLYLDGQGKCQKCHGTCAKCNGPAENQCSECPEGSKLISGRCVKCHVSCADCDGSGPVNCLSCPANGRLIVNGTSRRCVCQDGFFPTKTEPNTCQACNGACATCSGAAGSECTSCTANAEFIANPSGGNTCGCKAGFYASSLNPLKCQKCDSSCKTCDGAGANNCKSCYTDAIRSLIAGKCVTCDLKCIACSGEGPDACTACVPNAELVSKTAAQTTCKCRKGFASETAAPLRCQPYQCDKSCLTCTGPTAHDCDSCPDGQELFRGQCRMPSCSDDCLQCVLNKQGKSVCIGCTVGANLVNGACQCSGGYFKVSGPKLECSKCPMGCLGCNSISQCTKCVENASNSTGLCVCDNGFTKVTVNGYQCARCHVKCKTCSDTTDAGCTTCDHKRTLVNGKCITCSPICKTCNGEGDFACTSAPENAILVDTPQGKTVQCLPGFFSESKEHFRCKPYTCDSTCSTCFGPGANRCLTCKDDSKLAGGACVPVVCNANCKTCNSSAVDQCLSCIDGASLNSQTKKCECGDEYQTISQTPLVCQKYVCSSTCQTCIGTAANQCKTCITDAGTPVNGTCTCKNGTFLSTAGSCKPCDTTCSTCSGANYDECASCKPFHVLVGRQCIKCDSTCKPSSCNAAGPTGCTACREGNYQLVLVDGGKSCKCKDGYTGDTCLQYACDPSCNTCVGPYSNQCVDCPTGRSFDNGSCIKSSCHSSCLDCVGARAIDCISCPFGAELLLVGSANGICRPADGYYKSFAANNTVSFLPCDQSCKTCSAAGSTNCLSCNSKGILANGQCTCAAGYFLSSTNPFGCSVCDASCKTCNGNATNCTSCADGFQFSSNGLCFKCNSVCQTCSGPSANQCTKCTVRAALVSVSGGMTCQCPSGFFIGSNSPLSCQACDPSCVTCTGGSSNQCLTCPTNADLTPTNTTGTTCQCASGYAQASANPLRCVKQACDVSCADCSGPGPNKCTQCPPGSQLTNGACVKIQCHTACATCDGPNANQCLTCHANAGLVDSSGGKTCSCLEGYFIVGNTSTLTCSACDSSCKTCSGTPQNCSSCEGGGIVTNGACTCSSGSYVVTTSPFTCGACSPACATCNASGSGSCITCSPGYIQSNTTCFTCDLTCTNCSGPASNQCTTCPDNASLSGGVCRCKTGFIANTSSVALQCIAYTCDPTCATCTGPSKNQCRTCIAGLTKTIDGYCRGITCEKSCVTCNGTSQYNCTSCILGAALVLNTTTNLSACQCQAGFYQTASSPLACKACDSTCLGCDNTGQCTSCPSNSSPTGAPCACNQGFYAVTANGKLTCQACVTNCAQCASGGSCTLCASGFTLVSGQCIKCHGSCQSGQCQGPAPTDCLACPANSALSAASGAGNCVCSKGFYRDPTTETCLSCDSSCVACTGPASTQCSQCDTTSFLIDGQCQCKNGTYSLGATPAKCATCDASCITCKGPKVSDCTSCKAPSTLSSGGVCSVCDSSCDTCAGPNPTDCTGCRAGTALANDGTCQCQDGYYASLTTPLTCSPCDTSCQICTGAGNNSCSACPAGAVLVNGACTCGDGTFVQSTNPLVCGTCDSTCSTCSAGGSASCTQCANGLTLASGRCIACDPICRTCNGEGPASCTDCPPNADKVPSGTGFTCKCSSGYASQSVSPLDCEKYLCYPTCATCSGPNPNQCLSCDGGLDFDAASNLCTFKSCSANCVSCSATNASQCTACTAGAGLTPNNSCGCSDGYYQARQIPLVCGWCNNTCKTCNGATSSNCTSCVNNATLTNGVCVCNKGFFPGKESVFKCHRCHSTCDTCTGFGSDKCLSCPAGRIFYNGQCIKCNPICLNCTGETDSDCVAPAPPNAELYPKGNGNSVRCKTGFYSTTAAPLNCQPLVCDASCATCNGPASNQCTSCKDPIGQVLTGGACAPKKCHPTCATCDKSGSTECLSCPFGAELKKVNGDKGTCNCTVGYRRTRAIPLTCVKIKCDRTCNECIGGRAADCTTCIANAVRRTPSSPSSACDCKAGFYLSAQSCETCHTTCSTCRGPNYDQCLSCKANDKLIDGKCITCDSSCTECIGPAANQCTGGCNDGKTLQIVTGGKACQCPRGYFGAGCKSFNCSSPCKECKGPHRNQCTTCADGFILRGTTCVRPECAATCQTCSGEGEKNCTSCKTGSQLKLASATAGECIAKAGFYRLDLSAAGKLSVTFPQCDASCQLCEGPGANKCTECTAGAILSSGSCNCKDGMFKSASEALVCSACHSSCAKCKGPLATDCQSCPSAMRLTPSGSCVTCDPACLDCSAAGPGKCTRCTPSAKLTQLLNGQPGDLTCSCAAGTYQNHSAPVACQGCDDGCTACSATSACTACSDSAILKDGKCQCPDGFVASQPRPVKCVKKCPEGCGDCSGGICKACEDGYDLNNGTCIKFTCHSNCVTCDGSGVGDCASCPLGADFVEVPGGSTCACREGFKQVNDRGHLKCERIGSCHQKCKRCSQPNQKNACVACWRNAVLQSNGECKCPFQDWPNAPTLCSDTFFEYNEDPNE